MEKTIRNAEVEAYVAALTAPDSFTKTLKMPHAARQAIRVNLQTLTDRLRLYQEGRKDILDQAVKDGLAKEDGGGRYIIALEHQQQVSGELQELAEVKNNLNIECFDVDPILQDSNLTLAEEDVLLLFRKEEKE